jgi:hypothetical protein|tara:strand:+ start:344 stop:538 length:195 start_codon:yes stop_codon:yes gene_type:complete
MKRRKGAVITQVVLDRHLVVQALTVHTVRLGIICPEVDNGVVGIPGAMLEDSLLRTGIAPVNIR